MGPEPLSIYKCKFLKCIITQFHFQEISGKFQSQKTCRITCVEIDIPILSACPILILTTTNMSVLILFAIYSLNIVSILKFYILISCFVKNAPTPSY